MADAALTAEPLGSDPGSISHAKPQAQAGSAAGKHYTVLARRYRPQTFEEVIGQGHVARALKNAIATGRVAHAYLFTGARGVGKTSTARIFAKALNCPNSPREGEGAGVPCNACEICEAVSAGDDVDVLEIDGASNNGVDHVRDLRSNVTVKPMRARFKVYIIDEVHMLSKAAFNALLKTLGGAARRREVRVLHDRAEQAAGHDPQPRAAVRLRHRRRAEHHPPAGEHRGGGGVRGRPAGPGTRRPPGRGVDAGLAEPVRPAAELRRRPDHGGRGPPAVRHRGRRPAALAAGPVHRRRPGRGAGGAGGGDRRRRAAGRTGQSGRGPAAGRDGAGRRRRRRPAAGRRRGRPRAAAGAGAKLGRADDAGGGADSVRGEAEDGPRHLRPRPVRGGPGAGGDAGRPGRPGGPRRIPPRRRRRLGRLPRPGPQRPPGPRPPPAAERPRPDETAAGRGARRSRRPPRGRRRQGPRTRRRSRNSRPSSPRRPGRPRPRRCRWRRAARTTCSPR